MNANTLSNIEQFSLWNELKYVVENNKSNFLPYHNLNHTLSVMDGCFEIWQEILKSENESSLPSNNATLRNLMIASLFHDFNHSGGRKKDIENVEEAVAQFIKYVNKQNDIYYTSLNIDEIVFTSKLQLILILKMMTKLVCSS